MPASSKPLVLRIELTIAPGLGATLDVSPISAWAMWQAIADNLGDDWWNGDNGDEWIAEVRRAEWVGVTALSPHRDHEIVADWTELYRHSTRWERDGMLVIETGTRKSLDDSSGDTALWCLECDRDVTEEVTAFIDYS